jgi:heme oxygenase
MDDMVSRTSETAKAGLSSAFRDRTRTLHTLAERSGVVADLLKGRATRHGYALFLRNLLPAYAQIEKALEERRHLPGFRELAQPAVYRAASIESDLIALRGAEWSESLPLLPAGKRYQQRIAALATTDGAGLIAHVYVRYLGDLNGGRVLKRLLSERLGVEAAGLSFYDYKAIDDLDLFKIRYRESLDRAGEAIADIEPVVEEAVTAFRLNIDLSEAVLWAAHPAGAPPPEPDAGPRTRMRSLKG